jgi:hypothetical protein
VVKLDDATQDRGEWVMRWRLRREGKASRDTEREADTQTDRQTDRHASEMIVSTEHTYVRYVFSLLGFV